MKTNILTFSIVIIYGVSQFECITTAYKITADMTWAYLMGKERCYEYTLQFVWMSCQFIDIVNKHL